MCGCGGKTPLAKQTVGGNIIGKPLRYLPSHSQCLPLGDTRVCACCKKVLPLTGHYFGVDKRSPGSYLSTCKKCKKEKNQSYHAANREKSNKRARVYYAANKKDISEKSKIYRKRNQAIIRERKQARKEQIAKYNREWRKTNSGYMMAHKRRRRALILTSAGHHTEKDIENLYRQQQGKCCYCKCDLNNVFHVDHIVPLSRGGSNGVSNIAIACPFCNQSKGNKLLSEWENPRNPSCA